MAVRKARAANRRARIQALLERELEEKRIYTSALLRTIEQEQEARLAKRIQFWNAWPRGNEASQAFTRWQRKQAKKASRS